MAGFLRRELNKCEQLPAKIQILKDFFLERNVRNVLLYRITQQLPQSTIEKLIEFHQSQTNESASDLLNDVIVDIFTPIDRVNFNAEYGQLHKQSILEHRQVMENFTGRPRQTAIRGRGSGYRARGNRVYMNDA